MPSLDLYRSFLAVYRAGTLSGGARARHLTQPAMSQQLAALEALVGAPLFVRGPRGVQPTARGQELYAQVFESLDRLERVSRGLRRPSGPGLLRLGTTPEYLHAHALERLQPLDGNLSVRLGEARSLHAALEAGELDAVAAPLKPTGRGLDARFLHQQRYVLIGPATLQAPSQTEPSQTVLAQDELARWLSAQPWVSYSAERPVTRRLWLALLGRRPESAPRLTVPDLRAVLHAVELGYGLSLVPDFVARGPLAAGRVREVWPLGDLLPPESWWLAVRPVDADRPELVELAGRLGQAGG